MSAISVRGVSQRWGATKAGDGGELLVPLGPSGCGKSTRRRLIAGLEAVTTGRIFTAGEDVTDLPPARRRIAMVMVIVALLVTGCARATVFDDPTLEAKWDAGKFCEGQVHGALRIRQIDHYGRLWFSYRWENERAAFQDCYREQIAKRLPPTGP